MYVGKDKFVLRNEPIGWIVMSKMEIFFYEH